MQYHTHSSFFENSNPEPNIAISIFGVMDEKEEAFGDWEITLQMINTNYTGAIAK